MDFTVPLLAVSVTSFVAFIATIIKNFGVLNTISASDFKFNNPWSFTAFTWACSLPLVAIGVLEQSLLITFAGLSWAIVGAAPTAKNAGMEKEVHVIGAISAAVLGYTFVASTPYWYVIVPAIVASVIMWWRKVKNSTFWIETIAVVANSLGILLNYR
jgi:hypothetical protein